MMQRKHILLVLSCLAILILIIGCSYLFVQPRTQSAAHPAHIQATYYVAPDGNSNICSQFTPCSITAAMSKIRIVNRQMTGDIVVNILDGTYSLTSPLTFTATDSGSNGYNVIWQADGFGKASVTHPVWSGGQKVSGWKLIDQGKNIWRAEVSNTLKTRQLYVNGVRALRTASLTGIPGEVIQTATGYTSTDTSMQSWHNPENIEFVYSGQEATGGRFQEPRCDVAQIRGDSHTTMITMQQPCYDSGTSSAHGSANHFRIPTWIENAYELLTRPGQWYLDETGSVDIKGQPAIYYLPRTGEEMSNAEVIAPTLETLLQGQGNSKAPVHNIQFKGLTFSYATWLQPSSSVGFIQNQADSILVSANPLVYTFQPGNVAFHAAYNMRFERDIFTHFGTTGLVLDNGAQHNIVVGNIFTDISGTGIRVGNSNTLHPPIAEQEKDNHILNNYIHDIAVEFHGDDGVRVAYSTGTLVAHNEIANVPYDGIEVGNECASDQPSYSQDDHFSYNYIHDTMQSRLLGGDGGSIYVDSIYPRTTIDHNFFDNNLNFSTTGTIYTDCDARYFTISNNVVIHAANKWLHNTLDNTIEDNYTDSSYEDDGAGTLNHNHTNLTSLPSTAQTIIRNAGIEPAYSDILKGKTTIDNVVQGTEAKHFNFAGNWRHCVSIIDCNDPEGVLYNSSNSTAETANDTVKLSFTGTQITFCGVLDPGYGIAAISLDDSSEINIDLYSVRHEGNVLLWTSPTLAPGEHTFKLRVTGNKNPQSSGTTVSIDRVTISI